jgi:hypothetical protein
MTLAWPPPDRETMLAWQDAHGPDREIARAAGVSETTVASYRRRFDVGTVPQPARHAHERPLYWRRMPEDRIEELYQGRKYKDARRHD